MSRENTIGILGGYGAIGVIVAEDLLKHTGCNLLIAGRNAESIKGLVDRLGSRASGRVVDVCDESSVDSFCSDSFLVINSTAPSWEIGDKVLRSALKSGSLYVDPGIYFDNSGSYHEEYLKKGLTAVLYAGWVPGVTGILPRHLYNLYGARFSRIDSLHTFCGDRSAWSPKASVDIMHHFIKGVESGFFEKGSWKARSFIHDLLDAKFYKYPEPLGRYVVSPVFSIEHKQLAEEVKAGKLGFFAGIFGFRTLLRLLLIRYINMEDEKAVEILREALRREALYKGEGGAVVSEMCGLSQGSHLKVKAHIYERNSVWLTGICTSVAVRMLLSTEGRRNGVHFLSDYVDPACFLRHLEEYGVHVHIEGGGLDDA